MAGILIKADALTVEEEQKVLTMVRNLCRKRRKIGAEKLEYEIDINGNRHVSRQQS